MGLFFGCVHWHTSERKGCICCSCQEGKQCVAPRTELVPAFVIWVPFCVQKARSSWSWGDYRLRYMDVLLPKVWNDFPPKMMSDQAYALGPVSSRTTDGSPHYSHTQIHHNMETFQAGNGTEAQNMTRPNTRELFPASTCYVLSVFFCGAQGLIHCQMVFETQANFFCDTFSDLVSFQLNCSWSIIYTLYILKHLLDNAFHHWLAVIELTTPWV